MRERPRGASTALVGATEFVGAMASAAPSIKDKVDAIRRNLGFDDALTITEAVDRACGELELHDLLEQKKPLPERVDKCLEVLGISASDVGPPSGPSHAPPPEQFTPVEPVVVEAETTTMEEPQMMDDDEPVLMGEAVLEGEPVDEPEPVPMGTASAAGVQPDDEDEAPMMGLPQVAFEAPSIDWTKRKPSTPPAAKTPTPFASSYAGQSAAAKNQKANKITTINADGAHGHNGHSGRSGHYPGEHGTDAGDGWDGVRGEDINLTLHAEHQTISYSSSQQRGQAEAAAFGHVIGNIAMHAHGGSGGRGGDGGNGAKGYTGEKGRDATKHRRGGDGGPGGPGGDAGNAGCGGNGANGGNITVQV